MTCSLLCYMGTNCLFHKLFPFIDIFIFLCICVVYLWHMCILSMYVCVYDIWLYVVCVWCVCIWCECYVHMMCVWYIHVSARTQAHVSTCRDQSRCLFYCSPPISLRQGLSKNPKHSSWLEEQLVNSGDRPVFALQCWAYHDVQPCPCFYVGAELKLRSSSSQRKHTYSPVTLPAPLSAFNAFSFTCVHASLLFWSFTNPPCIFLSMTLLLVLTLIYLLSIHCTWNSYFVFKWTLENWIHILWKWNDCKNVSLAWSLFPLRLYFLFYFECHLKLSLPSFALLPTPSFFLFLPRGCGCCAVSQSKACLGFYLIWETPCPPQLHFEGRILFYWLL